MASKQLGKFRQWAGEVISSKDKTAVAEDFVELEKDIELRKSGLIRLYAATEAYHHSLSKKKESEAIEDTDKLLPIDILGIAMITHGEDFGDDSEFGSALVKFGRAQCKVATLQESYSVTLRDTFLVSMDKFREDVKQYEQQRKKLESRRLTLDAALSKNEKMKSSKKEKDRKDAEDELHKAQDRYEEMEADLRVQMTAIQENEVDQLRELTSFLDLQIHFVEQYLQVLKDTKSEWKTPLTARKPSTPVGRRSKGNSISILRPRRESLVEESYSSDESHKSGGKLSRPGSAARRRDSMVSSKPPSRPNSRASRHSTATEKDEKPSAEKSSSMKMSVVGWASSAVGSVTSIGKKGKDRFTSLYDDHGERLEDEEGSSGSPASKSSSITSSQKRPRSKSKDRNTNGGGNSATSRILKPPSMQKKKVVRALYDFSGSSDELGFKAGDEIVVINEVLDGWWMGELKGKKGLFPTSYVQDVSFSNGYDIGDSDADSITRNSDTDDDEAWNSKPLSHHIDPGFYGPADTMSITSMDEAGDDTLGLQPSLSRHPHFDTTTSSPLTTPKKTPPPPPPRRNTITNSHYTPPIPERRPGFARAHSASTTPASSISSLEYDISPFDSAADLQNVADTPTTTTTTGGNKGCGQFKQNPFKPKGMCSNCLTFHN